MQIAVFQFYKHVFCESIFGVDIFLRPFFKYIPGRKVADESYHVVEDAIFPICGLKLFKYLLLFRLSYVSKVRVSCN